MHEMPEKEPNVCAGLVVLSTIMLTFFMAVGTDIQPTQPSKMSGFNTDASKLSMMHLQ